MLTTRSSDRPASASPDRLANVAALFGLLSMLCVQFGVALSVPTMDAFGTFSTIWLRLAWAAVILALVVRPKLHRYSWRHWVAAGALGIAMAGMTLCLFSAIERIPIGLTVTIAFLGPLTVATASARRLRTLVWSLPAAAGVLLLAHDSAGWIGDPIAMLLAAGAGAGWGSYIVLVKKAGTLFNGLEGLSVSLIVAALAVTPFGIAENRLHVPPLQLATTAGLSLLVPLLPYALEMVALRHMPAASFGILMSLEPAIGTLAGFVVLDQAMTALQLAGTALVLSASVAVTVRRPQT
ncbi:MULTISPECIES: DMT family transporter [Paraburkholderia]|uniref:EamA family transporter n=1 Tax=Paraburkholderia TaxID=1822464 RepID=UPI000485E36B|nr:MULTISPECIES: EamA family transporter [Paraburkholderia]